MLKLQETVWTNAVQNGGDVAVGIKDRRVAAQLHDLANEHYVLADVVVKVLRGDARGRGSFGHLERIGFVGGCYVLVGALRYEKARV